ncbi:MAG: Hpt domain-containing protein, partial [Cyanobacteria bacterium]|nr:Hpt domain-containing protein [Cyanobacteriota bacterium]MDW8201504.1 Hpt domain-containing protein [Cyanobacteriota bacterium SKYGB_h_bin112]
MQPEQQQRITAYFIEEAKEHLATIEQGLSNLQATISDAEAINDVYRAAHSIKGGAAMLGFTGIQTVAHRLEDFFKVLRETPIRSDKHLESLFTAVYDVLVRLVGVLEQNGTLTAEDAQGQLAAIEPTITQLRRHLDTLSATSPVHIPITTATPAATSNPEVRSTMPEHSALLLTFQSDVPAQLREMLQLFKQGDSHQTRQALQDCCQRLSRIGEQFDLSRWIELLNLSQRAIAHEANSYRTLAQVVIKSIKQAQDLVLADQANLITPTDDLLALVPASEPLYTGDDESLDDLLSIGEELLLDSGTHHQSSALAELTEWSESHTESFDFTGLEAAMPDEISSESDDSLSLSDAPGPEVDIAE